MSARSVCHLSEVLGLKAFPLTIEFAQRLTVDQIADLVFGMSVYGHIEQGSDERTYLLYALRSAEVATLETHMANLVGMKLLRWRDCSLQDWHCA
jgi:hypothetical protein